jgi:hypothetical protein
MSSPNIEGLGDVINNTHYESGSAAEQYYKYMLMKEKFKVATESGLSAEQKKLLGHTSEREAIEMMILQTLTDITESSPEFAQVVDMTGTKDRYKQAEKLAADVYDKVRAENILKLYTPSHDELQGHFKARSLPSALKRTTALAGLPGTNSGAASDALKALATALGFGGPSA